MLPITIGTVYTSLMNLDWVLFIDVRYAPYGYKGRLNISRPYYRATLSLIRLSLAPELIKHLALLSPIYALTFRYYL
jgi:hypothetical protein